MTYLPNIPQPTDRPSQSQSQILSNFQVINSSFELDHVSLTNATVGNRGKHKKVTLISSSIPSTGSTDLALYSRTISGVVKLFFRYPSDGTIVQLSNINAPIKASNGYAWLPGGLAIQWGKGTSIPSGNTGVITFPLEFDATPYSIQLTVTRSTSSTGGIFQNSDVLSKKQFGLINTSSGSVDVFWIAIGPSI